MKQSSKWVHVVAGFVLLAGMDLGFCDGGRNRLEGDYDLEKKELRPRRGLKRTTLKTLSRKLVCGGLTTKKVEGAASSIPPSQLGTLFYGVAQELERQEGTTTETAVGYYMAVLTEPHSPHYGKAKRKIEDLVLRGKRPPDEVADLYDGGLAKFRELCESGVGISKEGAAGARGVLKNIETAYRARKD